MTATSSLYLTEAEVSAQLGVSRPTLCRWRRATLAGHSVGPSFVRLGPKRIGYSADALALWLKAQERAPSAA